MPWAPRQASFFLLAALLKFLPAFANLGVGLAQPAAQVQFHLLHVVAVRFPFLAKLVPFLLQFALGLFQLGQALIVGADLAS